MPRSRNYHSMLIEDLKDRDEAVAYLNAAFVESLKGDKESKQLFQIALIDVIEAQGGIEKLLKKTPLQKESIDCTLSPKRNIDAVNLGIVLAAMGIKMELA